VIAETFQGSSIFGIREVALPSYIADPVHTIGSRQMGRDICNDGIEPGETLKKLLAGSIDFRQKLVLGQTGWEIVLHTHAIPTLP
jgi:hypothetical protein